MAFEAFLAQDQPRPARRRRLTYSISLLAHGALLAAGIAYSFWHVDELSPPTVRVTFMSTAPPPPPPPPPPAAAAAAAGGGETKRQPVSKTRPTFTDLVQPKTIQPKREEPREEPKVRPKDDDDDDPDQRFAGSVRGGVRGGTIGGSVGGEVGGTVGGVKGGTIGGVVGAPARETIKFLPPQMADSQKLSAAEPDFPAVLRRTGLVYVVAARICVSKAGSVDSVAITKSADPLLDRNVLATVKSWRYRPFMSDGNPAPFCTLLRFEFKSD